MIAELADRRLALLGFGVENRALGAWLAAHSLRFTVCDADPERRAVDGPWATAVDAWRLGADHLVGLTDFDVVFRSPGLPARRPELSAARAAGVAVSSGIALFLSRCPAPVIGVTGTKGKGTTASWLMSLLEAGRVPARLGGNIGTPPVTFLDELGAQDLVVLELSSFQLEDLERSPAGAILLPVASDHLDHHADDAEYQAAKGTICRHQAAGDWALAAADCPRALRLGRAGAGRGLTFRGDGTGIDGDGCWVEGERILWRDGAAAAAVSTTTVATTADVRLRGAHNRGNACAAVAAALLAGVAAAAVPAGLRAFSGLPHRLEEVGSVDGVLYVNDSLATTPEAATAALAAFAERRVALIAGGSPKGAHFTGLGHAIARHAAGLVTLGAEGPIIARAAAAAGYAGPVVADCASMAAAVAAARDLVTAGDVVLLAPGCASFGMFTSYAARGEAFREAVRLAGAADAGADAIHGDG